MKVNAALYDHVKTKKNALVICHVLSFVIDIRNVEECNVFVVFPRS